MTARDRITVVDAYRKWKEQSPEIYQVVQQEGERPFAAGFSTGYSSALEAAEHKIESLEESMDELAKVLEVFARCADELDAETKDTGREYPEDEWAKFRLLVSDYRAARAALARYRGGV